MTHLSLVSSSAGGSSFVKMHMFGQSMSLMTALYLVSYRSPLFSVSATVSHLFQSFFSIALGMSNRKMMSSTLSPMMLQANCMS